MNASSVWWIIFIRQTASKMKSAIESNLEPNSLTFPVFLATVPSIISEKPAVRYNAQNASENGETASKAMLQRILMPVIILAIHSRIILQNQKQTYHLEEKSKTFDTFLSILHYQPIEGRSARHKTIFQIYYPVHHCYALSLQRYIFQRQHRLPRTIDLHIKKLFIYKIITENKSFYRFFYINPNTLNTIHCFIFICFNHSAITIFIWFDFIFTKVF